MHGKTITSWLYISGETEALSVLPEGGLKDQRN